jgi:hypothetical protein
MPSPLKIVEPVSQVEKQHRSYVPAGLPGNYKKEPGGNPWLF